MGDSKKKKKLSGDGGRRAQSKDHHSTAADNSEILTEEETALSCSKDTGYENSNVCAQLSLRCLPGYPYKCLKLQIIPEKRLIKN